MSASWKTNGNSDPGDVNHFGRNNVDKISGMFAGTSTVQDILRQMHTYLIYKSGSIYYAKSGEDGDIDYSNRNARALLQSISTALLDTTGASVKLFFKNGTYPMDCTMLTLSTTGVGATVYLEIEGESREGVIIKNTCAPPTNIFYMWEVYCNITIKNMTFDGDALGVFPGNNKVNGIVSETTSHTVTVSNCHFKKFTGIAVVTDQNCTGIDFRGNICDLGAGEEYLAFGCLDYGYIAHNFFDRTNATYNSWSVLTSGNAANCVIEGNVLKGRSGQQSWLLTLENIASHSSYNDVTIRGNIIDNGEIVVGGFDITTVTVRNISIDGNILNKGRIIVQGPSTSFPNVIKDVIIRNNHIIDSYFTGIIAQRVGGYINIENNTVRDSNLSLTASTGPMGLIFFDNVTDAVIKDNNLIMTNLTANASPYAYGGSSSTNIKIVNNHVKNLTANPEFHDWGENTGITRPTANADTLGATLAQLETEINEIKAALRSLGLMTTS